MGGFTETPETPAPAPEYPPENQFDPELFATQFTAGLVKAGVPIAQAGGIARELADALMQILTTSIGMSGEMIATLLGALLKTIQPILNELVHVATVVVEPGMTALAELSAVYVKQFVEQQQEIRPTPGGGKPSGLKPAAAGLFDAILAPLGFLVGGESPAKAGSGEANAQFVLGSITAIHLATWMVNIISNLFGLGALKWINSFDDVITAALSARGLSRMAMRPYLDKYIADPLRRDLNVAMPLAVGSASQLVKRYIRGNMSREELKGALRGLGYDDSVVEDMLLDTAKLLSVDACVDLANSGKWTEDQAIEHLEQSGYPSSLAPTVFHLARRSLIDSQMRSLAASLVDAFIDRRIDNPTLRDLLGDAGFTPDEVDAYSARGAILQEIPRKLSRGDVRALYQEGLVDLDYVRRWLESEGYVGREADLLELLEFTAKEERDARKRDQAERARIRDEKAAAALELQRIRIQQELAELST